MSFAELCERNLKISRAWFHKETFNEFGSQTTTRRSQLEPIKKTALTLQNHLFGLLNYLVHPITNALSEGFNSKIRATKADARGFRRFENYRHRVLFHCGKLDLRPTIP